MKTLCRFFAGTLLAVALFVAAPQVGVVAAVGNTAAALVDLNTATAQQLAALPGIGPVYAARIIAARPYTAKNQLVTRGIIPRETYNKVQGFIIAKKK